MTSTAIIRLADAPRFIDAEFVEDRYIVGVGDATITTPTPTTVSPATLAFVALGAGVAGFLVGYAACGIFQRG